MRIAVTYEDGQVFQHFGHTAQFKLYDTADGAVTASRVVDTEGAGHGALADFLQKHGANAVICGGIGGGARAALGQAGILVYGGVQGDADAAVAAYLRNELAYDPNAKCDHHDHALGEGHTCGSHGCGEHGCH